MSDRLTWQRGGDGAKRDEAPSAVPSGSTGKGEKLDFLYKQQEIDQEQYLTGKKVDKAFNDYLARENRNFESSLDPHKNESKTEFDVARKALEDPLLKVKQKETEKFKQLKANPQKMARLQKLMKAYLGQEENASSEDEKSSKRTRRRSSGEKRDRGKHDRRSRSRSRDRKRSRSRERSRRERSRSREKKEMPSGYGLINPKGTKARSDKNEKYESKFSAFKNVPHSYRRKEEHGFSKKMSAEEKARKLAEMAGNAESHDKIRQKRVADGRKKDAEDERRNEGKKNDHSFYRDMKMKATEKSLEERVKARTSANQKTAAALDKNWTKR